MKKRPKPCFKTLAILGCIAVVLLPAGAVVADAIVTRLIQSVRDVPEAPAPAEPATPALP
jgi:hypothetical protein